MDKHYDKIAFIAALFILLAGLAMGLGGMQSDRPVSKISPSDLKGQDWSHPEIKTYDMRKKTWDAASAQISPDKWVYGIFTPPKIFINPDTLELTEVPLLPPKPLPPFGLDLISVKQPYYKIDFNANFASGTGRIEDERISLYNHELDASKIQKSGTPVEGWGIDIRSFEIKKIKDPSSNISYKKPVVVIFDHKLQKEIIIPQGQRIPLVGEIEVRVQSSTGQQHLWDKLNATWRVGESIYTLLQIDFDKDSITVEKSSPELEEPIKKILTPKTKQKQDDPISTSDDVTPKQNKKETNGTSFDSLFNN